MRRCYFAKGSDLIATDDHADIRGLATAILVFVAKLPLSIIGCFSCSELPPLFVPTFKLEFVQ
jgi:hypothetical protein